MTELEFDEFIKQMPINSKIYLEEASKSNTLMDMLGYIGLQLYNLNQLMAFGINELIKLNNTKIDVRKE